ncbi:MAG: PIN domain-containing protein [Armatimonadota bacterium]|nr:PIN domain-containing protein [Armatimonadota bacterium]
MRVLLDTSVLVSAVVEAHPRHEWSLNWLKRAHHSEIEAVVSAHSLLEMYAVLTRLPLHPPTPAAAGGGAA